MRVGIVGGGQLARMLLEAASALGLDASVLAVSSDDAAARSCADVVLGPATDLDALRLLAERCDVVTFDHELVDLDQIAALESEGHLINPSSSALRYAVDKAAMRQRLEDEGLPMPRYCVASPGDADSLDELIAEWGLPVVVKAARGGYDGKGVYIAESSERAREVIDELHGAGVTALIEEHVAIRAELAALVARRSSGSLVTWPVVETAQIDGVCREVLVPGSVSDEVKARARAIAEKVASVLGVVGVMAVELFETDEGVVINELAMRPHNSGHWTQDGSVTSQFENHLRSVLDLPLGATDTVAEQVASVNVFGADAARSLDDSMDAALRVEGAHVHLYGKEPRAGRKLGHVTVTGDDAAQTRRRAWQAATALGTPLPPAMEGVLR